jgi:hypothetical protein
MSILEAVQAVKAVEKAKQRIPKEIRGVTFYSTNDNWQYYESESQNMCSDCHSYNLDVYSGDELRSSFPYHEVVNESFIYAHVHPHCVCFMVRVFPVTVTDLELEEE